MDVYVFFFPMFFFFRKIENFWKSKKKNTEKITIDWGHIEDLKKPFSAQKTWFLPPFFEFFRFFKKSELFWGNRKTVKKLSFSAKKGVFSLINITGTKGNFSCIFLVVLKKFRFSKKKTCEIKKHACRMFFYSADFFFHFFSFSFAEISIEITFPEVVSFDTQTAAKKNNRKIFFRKFWPDNPIHNYESDDFVQNWSHTSARATDF